MGKKPSLDDLRAELREARKALDTAVARERRLASERIHNAEVRFRNAQSRLKLAEEAAAEVSR